VTRWRLLAEHTSSDHDGPVHPRQTRPFSRLSRCPHRTRAFSRPGRVSASTPNDVRDIAAAEIEGLDGATSLDRAPGAASALATRVGPVAFTGETDRVYDSTSTSAIIDAEGNRTITVAKAGSASTVPG
jgi:hypothetical protein